MNLQTLITQKVLLMVIVLTSFFSNAQYDTIHYLPPFYVRSMDTLESGTGFIFLSTNEDLPFEVSVFQADGTPIAFRTISKDQPGTVWLGNHHSGKGIVDSTELNSILTKEGIILTGSRPFFANLRHNGGRQATSVSCKGNAAKGKRFRTGHLYTVNTGENDGVFKSHMISVMATEDNTEINFKDIKQGVIFYGLPKTGNTTDDFTITLNKYESYVLGAHLDEPMNTGNDTLINGILVESTKPIVMNSGSWTGGANAIDNDGSRDIGVDQTVPVNMIGSEYILTMRSNYLPSQNERPIIIADMNDTEVFINNNPLPIVTLNSGEFYIVPANYFDTDGVMYVRASKNVYIYQSVNTGDAACVQALNVIPPIACDGINSVNIPLVQNICGDRVLIDVIADSGASLLINGQIPPPSATVIQTSIDKLIYRFDAYSSGDVLIESDSPILVNITNFKGIKGMSTNYSGFSDRFSAPNIYATTASGNNQIKEGCIPGFFVIEKPIELLQKELWYTYEILGSAVNGIDFVMINDSVFIQAGQLSDTISIYALNDGLIENSESIKLRLFNPSNCEFDSALEAELIIEPDVAASFTADGGSHCAPYEVQFNSSINVSSDTNIQWDFGDGTVSNELNPSHLYTESGQYSVTMLVIQGGDCPDTTSFYQSDLIQIYPSPVAGFDVNISETDICNPEVLFTDLSEDATSYYYFFDDGAAISNDANPEYMYTTSGSHQPVQVVTNEFGCSDSTYMDIYVEPFNVFVPNAFTPDGNEFNNTFEAVVDMELYEYNLTIYNRWGETVFATNDINYGWDGTTQTGDQAPTGTYQWVLTYVSCEPINPRQILQGHVSLLR